MFENTFTIGNLTPTERKKTMANSPNAEATPILYWNLVTNFNPTEMPGATFIGVPTSGTLSVIYDYQDDRPAKRIYVQRQSGNVPINPGQNTVPVSANDGIVYGRTHRRKVLIVEAEN